MQGVSLSMPTILSTQNPQQLPQIDPTHHHFIGTHSGAFHCDQALACAMITSLQQFQPCTIVRSRNKQIHKRMEILLDVGGQFQPSKNQFDHHQRSFTATFSNKTSTVKMSSAGLAYKYYGKRILQTLLKNNGVDCSEIQIKSSNDQKRDLFKRIYETFILPIDGIDNGINEYQIIKPKNMDQEKQENQEKEVDEEKKLDNFPRVVRNYKDSTTLPARVSRLNPAWNIKKYDPSKHFQKAMKMCYSEFQDHVLGLVNIVLPAQKQVEKAFNKRSSVHQSNKIVYLQTACPWRDTLIDIQKANKCEGSILFVIYADQNNNFRVQALPKVSGSFTNRLSLKEQWRGLRDEELAKVSGIEGAIFVHANGFIGGAQTYQGVLKMALRTIQDDLKGS